MRHFIFRLSLVSISVKPTKGIVSVFSSEKSLLIKKAHIWFKKPRFKHNINICNHIFSSIIRENLLNVHYSNNNYLKE